MTQIAGYDEKFESFLAGVKKLVDDHRRERFPNLSPEWLIVNPGRRYDKIIRCDDWNVRAGGKESQRVYIFVDRTNGNVLRPAGFHHPKTKHPRGNIFDDHNGLKYIWPYGVFYLEQMKRLK